MLRVIYCCVKEFVSRCVVEVYVFELKEKKEAGWSQWRIQISVCIQMCCYPHEILTAHLLHRPTEPQQLCST